MRLIFPLLLLVFIAGCTAGPALLPPDMCTYGEEKRLTCGRDFTVVLEGRIYTLAANQPLDLPEAEYKYIGLVNPENVAESYILVVQVGTFRIDPASLNGTVGEFLPV